MRTAGAAPGARTSRCACRDCSSDSDFKACRIADDTSRWCPSSLIDGSEPRIRGSSSCTVRDRTRFHQLLRLIAAGGEAQAWRRGGDCWLTLRCAQAERRLRPYLAPHMLRAIIFATLAAAAVVSSLRAWCPS